MTRHKRDFVLVTLLINHRNSSTDSSLSSCLIFARLQREQSTSVPPTSISSRRMAGCACPSAWRVTGCPTAERTSSPTRTRPASRWRHNKPLSYWYFSGRFPYYLFLGCVLIIIFSPQIHWSSVLLSLISYILLAITMLLCMSCFARILIQWSVRSSMEEMRGSSVRSSSRFFSLFGGSFSRHWDRPPPTYDESLKHINPDLQQGPPDPPPYSESFRARSVSHVATNNSPKPAWHNSVYCNNYDDQYCASLHHTTVL